MTRPKLYRPRLLELVRVRWKDAQFDNDYDGPADREGGGLALLDNVGYFCAMNRERIQLASCREVDEKNVRQLVNIPVKMIASITSLEPQEASSATKGE